MNKSPRNAAADPPAPAASLACDPLLWIGETDHPAMREIWQICQSQCETMAVRSSIGEATTSPLRRPPTHVLIAQTNRHEAGSFAIHAPEMPTGGSVSDLIAALPDSEILVVRGPLVAPTVQLPPTGAQHHGRSALRAETVLSTNPPTTIAKHFVATNAAPNPWVDSISAAEAIAYLPDWLARLTPSQSPDSEAERLVLPPLVVVAARYCFAESYLDSLSMLNFGSGERPSMVRWQRDLTTRSASGFEIILWDESAAPPTTADGWQTRCQLAPKARHIWVTGTANDSQKQVARENGIQAVIEKPARLECLLGILAAPSGNNVRQPF